MKNDFSPFTFRSHRRKIIRKISFGASRSSSDRRILCPMSVAWPISTVIIHFLSKATQIASIDILAFACAPLISLSLEIRLLLSSGMSSL